jgi:DMSO reductase family type II enzyme heme b subunit
MIALNRWPVSGTRSLLHLIQTSFAMDQVFRFGAVLLLGMGVFGAEDGLSEKAKQGKALYDKKCSQCHGETGDGKGVGAHVFRPLPRDFTLGVYKFRSTASGELPTHADLMRSIRRGMAYTGMPGWPNFSDEEVDALATYIETFSEDFADTSEHPTAMEIPTAPKFNPENVDAGRKLFEANKCFDCHGQKGFGDGESAPTLTDDWGAPIRPADFSKPWTFRSGSEREDIYRTISTGLNGTPMPSFANDISPEDRWELVDYVQSISGGMHKADYGLTVVAGYVEKADLSASDSLFSQVVTSTFPVIGQVVEDPRAYAPGVNAISVAAIYDSSNLVIQLKWHNMSADTAGQNSPITGKWDSSETFTDAVSIQVPSKPQEGKAKPYFLMGDKKNPVEHWFVDLSETGKEKAQVHLAKGAQAVSETDRSFPVLATFEKGEWTVRIQRPLSPESGLRLATEDFIPISFFVWDGSLGETGKKSGLTSWYSLYLKKPSNESPLLPASKTAGLVLLVQVLLIWGIRQSLKPQSPKSDKLASK